MITNINRNECTNIREAIVNALNMSSITMEDASKLKPYLDLANNLLSRTVRVPLLWKIAAGKPINIPTESSSEDYTNAIELSRDQIGAKTDLFALQIKGNSMIDALIQDGDIIILERTNQFDNGDMVAVWIKSDNSTTFKRIYKLDNKIKLEPMNKKMKSFYIDPSSFQVQGRFVTSIRHW